MLDEKAVQSNQLGPIVNALLVGHPKYHYRSCSYNLTRNIEEFDPIVSEVLAAADVECVGRYVDMFQIGTRNMQNYRLLEAVGKTGKPVLLKRGYAATVRETLMSAEYILAGGNRSVVLCERGIKSFQEAVPVIKATSHLPILVDPSHAAGVRGYVCALALAGIAAGADGILVEVHDRPAEALCDGPQALLPDMFAELTAQIEKVAGALGRGVLKRKPE